MTSAADALQEKMAWLGRRLEEAGRRPESRRRPPKAFPLREAHAHLYAAQSRDVLTREIPEGTPLLQHRRELFGYLLKAERTLDGLEPQPFVQGAAAGGKILLRSSLLTVGLDLKQRGRLLELSDKPAERNLLDLQTERRAGPRQAASAPRVFRSETSVRDLAAGAARELKGFFGAGWKGKVQRRGATIQAVMETRGLIGFRRTISLKAGSRKVTFEERLENRSGRPLKFLFGAGLALSLKDAHVNRMGEVAGLRRFSLVDPAARLEVRWDFSRPARLWHFPLERRIGPGNKERAYQGVSLTAVWPVEMRPRDTWVAQWELAIGAPDGIELIEKENRN